jgi:hypothetical protein
VTAIEPQHGPCADLFDMVAGTSIGGIIATGLAHRVPAQTIRGMLTNDGGTIFANPSLGVLGPKYDAAPLENFLNQTFGDAMLNGIAKPELIVPTVDLIRPTSMFFKSWRAGQDASYNFALKDMTRATSAAETYFAPANITSASGEKYCCVDGGTAINNPTIAAILEAEAMWPGADLRVLSLGTSIRTTAISPGNGSLEDWALKIVPLFQDSQTSVPHHLAKWAIPSLVRCDIELGPAVDAALDDASPGNIAALVALGNQLVTAQLNNALTILASPQGA